MTNLTQARLAIVLFLVAMGLAACGGGPTHPGNKTSTGQGRVTDALFDCSSFRKFAGADLPDILSVAETVATQHGKFEFACIDGSPLTDARFITVDFGVAPPGTDGLDPGILQRYNIGQEQLACVRKSRRPSPTAVSRMEAACSKDSSLLPSSPG